MFFFYTVHKISSSNLYVLKVFTYLTSFQDPKLSDATVTPASYVPEPSVLLLSIAGHWKVRRYVTPMPNFFKNPSSKSRFDSCGQTGGHYQPSCLHNRAKIAKQHRNSNGVKPINTLKNEDRRNSTAPTIDTS
jgi:hypothetical protein